MVIIFAEVTYLFCIYFPQEFIRLGSLSKLSGKGLQQRMFFLVSKKTGFFIMKCNYRKLLGKLLDANCELQ